MDSIGNGEYQVNTACPPTKAEEIFSHENIQRCEREILRIQRKLDKAVANDDKKWLTS